MAASVHLAPFAALVFTSADAFGEFNFKSLFDTFLRDLNVTLQDQASAKRCLGRKPREKSEYDDAQINSLDNLRVVMEVWGAIENQSTGDGEFGFVLVPTRSIAPPAVFVVKDNFNGKLDSILKRNKQRQAFAPVVLGTRYYQNHNYLEALPLLCQGCSQRAFRLRVTV